MAGTQELARINMEQLFAIQYAYLIPLLPLIGAVIAGFFCTGGRKTLAHWPIWIGVGASAVLSLSLLFGMMNLAHGEGQSLSYVRDYYSWISAGSFHVRVSYLFDPLTAVMLCVVTGVGFLITVFSAGYMKGEEGYSRFFAFMGLFIFMMTNLVMGANLVMLYLGWEGVGLCSYLLIGYYYERPAARDAAKKAFLVNRIGDFGFGLGIMLTFLAFGTVSFFGDTQGTDGFLNMATHSVNAFQQNALKWLPFLLMLGAFGKSAQFPLYVWLPDAMEGPTPVSALIHAATMVTAGVYMIARCGTVFVGNEAAMWTIAIVGAFTALFSATIALRQFDLKKVFAYSTISQLGFMFVAVGVLAPVAGVFHLVTHAFFKALLFLSSGVVMHAMGGILDMRKMSGIRRVLPITRWLMLIGCAALAGFPLLSGFFSKDEIVAASMQRSTVLGIVMLLTAFLTAYYTFRVYFRVFEGPEVLPEGSADGHGQGHDAGHEEVERGKHNHEPMLMILPLVVLAIGALVGGWLNHDEGMARFLGQSPSFIASARVLQAQHDGESAGGLELAAGFGQHVELSARAKETTQFFHLRIMIISGFIALGGIALAYMLHLHNRKAGDALVARYPLLTRVLERKYYVDEIYQAAIVEPLRACGRLFFGIDNRIIDGVVWLIGFVPQGGGFTLKLTTQRGQLQGYALTMLLGVVLILWIVLSV